ncbi:hypothetical protein Bca52824_088429 [Brassica carinata]|uniref:Uncharacterized protein n=1 Tax=Brassica carinata TaxID=52824 RepID=A0A8X7PBE7_BRACI|nr:hypothetical protein Bca52824_088429 [Brassica carinata]
MEAITDLSTPAFLREVEASSASPPPVQVPGKGSLVLVETAWWLLSSGCLFGSEWMRYRYKVKLSIIGDDDKRKKVEALVSSSSPPASACLSSGQPPTGEVLFLESRRGCGKDGTSWFGCLCSRRRRVNLSGGKGDDACDAFSWVFAVNSGG